MRWLRQLFGKIPRIPDALWRDCTSSPTFLRHLATEDVQRLKSLCEEFLATKTVTGAGGLIMTDEIAVHIALQACLPILNLKLSLYRDMTGVVVYPAAFLVVRREMDEAGVVHEWQDTLSGEAMDAGGAVVLSWDDVDGPFRTGHSVVIHEFAHKIDMLDGGANGGPPFLAGFHKTISPADWQTIFASAYEDLVHRVTQWEATLPEHDDPHHSGCHGHHHPGTTAEPPIDPYAATDPAEFFAVTSEAFFVTPTQLHHAYPQVYQQLALYYRQDPLAFA